MPPSVKDVHRYHDGTKHQFDRFARSTGYLDWASQPAPFRSFEGSRVIPLHPAPSAIDRSFDVPDVSYDSLFLRSTAVAPLGAGSVGYLLRHSLGLSAWKQAGASRWSLRVNPSSGNLHPTEAYVACGPMDGLSDAAGVYHYAPDRHALEERCAFDPGTWMAATRQCPDVVLVALTSIHWREAWKYGERAFRYCQHDVGHAIGALTYAASALGWDTRLLPSWSHAAVAALTGADRDGDFVDSEREEPACVIAVGPARPSSRSGEDDDSGERDSLRGIESAEFVSAVRGGRWSGRASQLSTDHVQWTFIDDVAEATRTQGAGRAGKAGEADQEGRAGQAGWEGRALFSSPAPSARQLFLQRRSAVAFDARTHLSYDGFLRMLDRVLPRAGAPWDVLLWEPRVHLLLFVHRVETLAPGLYFLSRSAVGGDRVCAAMGRAFSHDRVHDRIPLIRLASGDCRQLARRLSCDQDIAADGCFSAAMLAEFDRALDSDGSAAYRQLFWETGVIGQVLYLEAEAYGIRGTGIGCFYDDQVHDTLGLTGHVFQSLYHFTVGAPVEDRRLSTEPGYSWG